MILTLEEAKRYIKVDFDDENEEIQDCIDAAEEYLKEATGKEFNSENKRAKKYCKVLVKDWYDNRELMADKKTSNKVRFTLQSIMTQLKYGD
ncbi:head-tail connector protein [Romboutsia sp. 1001216sp1]|uniref:head-tail connector protein n=1 Tax=unclassified Romboutsia TaxID=2626894 RepID=UPI00189CDD8C|nr:MULTISPECIES: head-tail connector protein [unclassified Romboutsia]MDB8790635.1 head-tail connector protein [Romboutsia sp. 1001216sp1]MDB8803254.1 head-tail connector protein [Romboutsia sp. 1001216sp1]MDB8814638.1 head-tail connector protein [Romboutsia sp. 1001216sp1]